MAVAVGVGTTVGVASGILMTNGVSVGYGVGLGGTVATVAIVGDAICVGMVVAVGSGMLVVQATMAMAAKRAAVVRVKMWCMLECSLWFGGRFTNRPYGLLVCGMSRRQGGESGLRPPLRVVGGMYGRPRDATLRGHELPLLVVGMYGTLISCISVTVSHQGRGWRH